MNILHVITHGGWAGSESIAGAIANEQASRGHQVTVILRRNKSFKDSEIKRKFQPSVKIFWVEQLETHPDNQIITLLKNEDFIKEIYNIEIFHAHLPYGCLLGELLKNKYDLKFKICVSMHVRYHPLYYFADKLFTVANWQLAEVPKDYPGDVYVVENFLCDHNIDKEKKLNIFKKKYHICSTTKYIVYIGRLDLVKGPDVLVRAFNKAAPKDYKLIIIGDGPETNNIRKIASENIIFTGRISDASFVLDIADIAIIPSRFESFGLVLLEAIHSGKRVIATNIPSFKEILGSDECLFENENVNSLTKKIIDYSLNPDIGFAKKTIKNNFSLTRSLDKLDAAYFGTDFKTPLFHLENTIEEPVDKLDVIYHV